MGSYTNWGLVAGRYPPIANARTEADAETNFIAGAEGELDARLAPKYTTPFTTVPEIIKDLATDLTYVKMRHFHKDVQGVIDHIEARIKGLLEGTIVIPGATESSTNQAWVNETYHSAFGMDDSSNWSRDEDQLTEASDARV